MEELDGVPEAKWRYALAHWTGHKRAKALKNLAPFRANHRQEGLAMAKGVSPDPVLRTRFSQLLEVVSGESCDEESIGGKVESKVIKSGEFSALKQWHSEDIEPHKFPAEQASFKQKNYSLDYID